MILDQVKCSQNGLGLECGLGNIVEIGQFIRAKRGQIVPRLQDGKDFFLVRKRAFPLLDQQRGIIITGHNRAHLELKHF